MKVLLVSAESLVEGYAANARINANIGVLESLGHSAVVIGEDDGPYFEASLWQRIKRYARINWRVVNAMADHDVLIARGHFAHLPWVFVAWRRGKPIVYEMNGFVFDAMTTYNSLRLVQPLIKRIYMLQFRMATTIMCLSGEIAAHIRKLGDYRSVTTVANGVDSDLFRPSDSATSENYAIFASSLAPWHGTDALLDAVNSPHWPSGLKLVIAGDGVQADAVRQRAAETPVIDYVGLLDRVRLADIMRRASIGLCLIQPVAQRGVSEVYPLKLFEMMASGLPIVATDLPGQREIVETSGAGIVVPLNDSDAIARAVRNLYVNPRRRDIGLAAAAAVRERFDWRYGAALMQKILDDAVARAGVERDTA